MPTLDEVYRKFGEVSQAAQLLETELGTILFAVGAIETGLVEKPDRARASDLIGCVNRQTLGQLLKTLNRSTDSLDQLETVMERALAEGNRLSHAFYREHNFRRSSEEGRTLMMKDLEGIHNTLLDAYKAVMLLAGIDLDTITIASQPTDHVPT